MKLQIPGIGDVLRLTEPWTFTLKPEDRNKTAFAHFFPGENYDEWCQLWFQYKWGWQRDGHYEGKWPDRKWIPNPNSVQPPKPDDKLITIPMGVRLVVDRYYMAKINTMYRGGSKNVKDYHSLTFVVNKGSNILGNKKRLRFFASLSDCNKIVYDINDTDEAYTGLEIGVAKKKKPEKKKRTPEEEARLVNAIFPLEKPDPRSTYTLDR